MQGIIRSQKECLAWSLSGTVVVRKLSGAGACGDLWSSCILRRQLWWNALAPPPCPSPCVSLSLPLSVVLAHTRTLW